jgi:predicted Zn-dependent protease with MMP-like domain
MTDWHKHRAPNLAEFEAIANAAYRKLPKTFRDMTKDVLIQVADFPTDEVLDSLGIDSPFGLLGLYHGVDLTR